MDAAANMTVVYFDLETTGLERDCDLTEIAGAHAGASFHQYVLPRKSIPARVTEVTGLSVKATDGQRTLCHNGVTVEAVSVSVALKRFCDWLPKPSLLCAHNALSFDVRVLRRAIAQCNLVDEFQHVVGFADTLPLLKQLLPKEASLKLTDVYFARFGRHLHNAHAADADVAALMEVLDDLKVDKTMLCKHSATLQYLVQCDVYKEEKARCLATLAPRLGQEVSKAMLAKIAGSGLQYEHLKLAFVRDRQRGISLLFTEKSPGGANRVTAHRKVIDAVMRHFQKAIG